MPRPNPVQNGGAATTRNDRRNTAKPSRFTVRKLSAEEKAARRDNPHAAALATAKRGGLFRPTTRADQAGVNKNKKPKQPRLMLPRARSIARPAARDAEGEALNLARFKSEVLASMKKEIQQILPGAAGARELADTLDRVGESINAMREEMERARDQQAAETDLIFEALAGDKQATEKIKAAIGDRRVDAKRRAETNG